MIVFAVNIHCGGGAVLLNTLLENQVWGKVTRIFVDTRFQFENYEKSFIVHRVKPRLISRYLAELKLKYYSKENVLENILFFGNLPPICKFPNKCILFLQNAYLLRNIPINLKFKQAIRIHYERLVFYRFIKNIDEIIVQTEWMRNQLKNIIRDKACLIKPILPVLPEVVSNNKNTREYNLIAVTGAEEHKNLSMLCEALESLKYKAKVCLIANVDVKIKNKNISLDHFKKINREDLFSKYKKSDAIVVLSEFESFCLPLYEAKHFGVKIISPIKGYINKEVYPDYKVEELTVRGVMDALAKSILAR